MSAYFDNTIARIGIDITPLQEKMQQAKGAVIGFQNSAMISLRNLRVPNVNIGNYVESIQQGARTTLNFTKEASESIIQFQTRVATELARVGVDFRQYETNLEGMSVITARFARGQLQTIDGMRAEAVATENLTSKFGMLKEMMIGFAELWIIEKFIEIGGELVKAGETAQDTEHKFKYAFGNMGTEALKWAEKISGAMGVSKEAFKDLFAKSYDTQFNIGFSPKKSEEMAKNVTQLSYDFSKKLGTTPEEAFEKINRAMEGTAKGLKALNIVVSQNDLAQEAMRLGIKGSASDWTDAQKSLISYNVLMNHSASTMGYYGLTSGDLSTKITRMKATFEDLADKLGGKLLPEITVLVDKITNFFDALQKVDPELNIFTTGINAAVAGVAAFVTYSMANSIISLIPVLITATSAMWTFFTATSGSAVAAIALDAALANLPGVIAGVAAIAVGIGTFVLLQNEMEKLTQAAKDAADAVDTTKPLDGLTDDANKATAALNKTVASFDQVHNLAVIPTKTLPDDSNTPKPTPKPTPTPTSLPGFIMPSIGDDIKNSITAAIGKLPPFNFPPTNLNIGVIDNTEPSIQIIQDKLTDLSATHVNIPITVDDQTRQKITNAEKNLQELKQGGIYNPTTIVIQADDITPPAIASVELNFDAMKKAYANTRLKIFADDMTVPTISSVELNFNSMKKAYVNTRLGIFADNETKLGITQVKVNLEIMKKAYVNTRLGIFADDFVTPKLPSINQKIIDFVNDVSLHFRTMAINIQTQTSAATNYMETKWDELFKKLAILAGKTVPATTTAPSAQSKWRSEESKVPNYTSNLNTNFGVTGPPAIEVGEAQKGAGVVPPLEWTYAAGSLAIPTAAVTAIGIGGEVASTAEAYSVLGAEYITKIEFYINVMEDIMAALRSIRPHAEGGIVTSPQIGLIGEAGPEAIIPLSQLSQLNNAINGGSGNNKQVIQANIDNQINVDGRQLSRVLRQYTIHEENRIGTPISSVDSSVNYPK